MHSNLFTPQFVYHLLLEQGHVSAINTFGDGDKYRIELMDAAITCLELTPNMHVCITGNEKYDTFTV